MPQNPWEIDWSKAVPAGKQPWEGNWSASANPNQATGMANDPTRDMSPGQLRIHLGNESALSMLEGFGVDPSSPVVGTSKNIARMLKNLAVHPMDSANALAKAPGQYFINAAHVIGSLAPQVRELVSPGSQTEDVLAGSTDAASEAGKMVPNAAVTAGAAELAKALALKATGALARNTSIVPSLDTAAAANKAGALNPSTLEGRAGASKIAPELSRNYLAKGLRQKTIDANISKQVDAAGARVGRIEAKLAESAQPEMQISRDAMLQEIDGVAAKLDTNINPEAMSAIQRLRKSFESLPKFADFKDVIRLRRNLDQAALEKGAFKDLQGVDRVNATVTRGMADIARRQLNELDPALKSANHEFWTARKAADIVKRRQMGEYGKISSGLPGRGSLLDDILAGSAGGAVAGPAGAAVTEAVNLARQTPGWANLKSGFQQKLADALRQPAPNRLLLGSGLPELGPNIPKSGPAPNPDLPPLYSGQANDPYAPNFNPGPMGTTRMVQELQSGSRTFDDIIPPDIYGTVNSKNPGYSNPAAMSEQQKLNILIQQLLKNQTRGGGL